MNKNEAVTIVESYLSESRFQHTIRVAETAKELAKKYGVDIEKAETAAIWHDIAKYFDHNKLYECIQSHSEIPNSLLHYHNSLWHAHVGAVYVRETYNILDQDILNAMTYHTTGRSGMSKLEKVIFLADYIEPGRDFPGVQNTRQLAEKDLDGAICQALINTMQFLLSKNQQIHPDTVNAYNDLVKSRGRVYK